LKLAFYRLLITKLPSTVEVCNAGKANLSLILSGLLLLLLSDGLSVSSGGYLDISELFALTDGLIFECLAASLLSLFLANPIVIEQLWRLISYIIKLINKLNLSVLLPDLSTPLPQLRVQAAHGCRAPPFFTFISQ
jgi:hypothetical protein